MGVTEYHCHDSCNKCAGLNDVKVINSLDGQPLEYETKCQECGHEDYWCTGFFLSSEHMESNCKKYSFNYETVRINSINITNTKGYEMVGDRTRVICPDCGIGGATSYPCTCHVCEHEVLMLPAGNDLIRKNWNEIFKPCQ